MKTAIQQEKLPTDWSTVELGELLERITNGLTCEQEKEPPGIPITRIETISNGVVDFARVRYVRDLDEAKKARFILQRGDILFSHINSDLHLGKTAVVTTDKPLLHGMNLLLLRTKKEQLDPYYLHYLLNYYRRSGAFMAIAQHAVNQSSLNQKKIYSLKVPLAPLDQQKRIIAEIEKQFSRLDEAVANLKRVKANLKRYKAAVLKAAVEGRLVETEAERARREGRNYETGAQLLQRILETRRSQWQGKGKYKEPAAPDTTDLPILPEGWSCHYLEMISDVLDPNPRHRNPTYVENGYHFFSTAQFSEPDGIDLATAKSVSEDTVIEQERRCAFSSRSIAFSRKGTIGKTRFLPTGLRFALLDSLCVINCSELLSERFVNYQLMGSVVQKQIAAQTRGVALKQVSVGAVRGLRIPLPPNEEQERIVSALDAKLSLLYDLETKVYIELTRAERLRQSVLQRAFSREP